MHLAVVRTRAHLKSDEFVSLDSIGGERILDAGLAAVKMPHLAPVSNGHSISFRSRTCIICLHQGMLTTHCSSNTHTAITPT